MSTKLRKTKESTVHKNAFRLLTSVKFTEIQRRMHSSGPGEGPVTDSCKYSNEFQVP
jgi:hypothetical protein